MTKIKRNRKGEFHNFSSEVKSLYWNFGIDISKRVQCNVVFFVIPVFQISQNTEGRIHWLPRPLTPSGLPSVQILSFLFHCSNQPKSPQRSDSEKPPHIQLTKMMTRLIAVSSLAQPNHSDANEQHHPSSFTEGTGNDVIETLRQYWFSTFGFGNSGLIIRSCAIVPFDMRSINKSNLSLWKRESRKLHFFQPRNPQIKCRKIFFFEETKNSNFCPFLLLIWAFISNYSLQKSIFLTFNQNCTNHQGWSRLCKHSFISQF